MGAEVKIMKPKILDDWHWFLICYSYVLFRPFEYMKIVLQNKGWL